ncbi:MAG TPA: hypothetical protein VGP76_07580 [Planctomycetaceae bacterium]|jgi:hypothetical protein|nr:hypothetical protein [Planctomycetaceae bacterium]
MNNSRAITMLIAAHCVLQGLPCVAEPPAFDRQALVNSYSAHVRPKGTWESVDWPDTLDLSERGRLGVQALTGNLDPANSYAPYSYFNFQGDCGWYEWFHTHDYLQALLYGRAMSGSAHNIENELGLVSVYLNRMKIDDLHDPSGPQYGAAIYYPTLKLQKFPNGGVDELPDRMSVAKNGLSVAAMFTCFYHDGNPGWLQAASSLANGLVRNYAPGNGIVARLPVVVADRAYYPPECTFDPLGRWFFSNRGKAHDYTPPDEPPFDYSGAEGAARWYVSTSPLLAITQVYGGVHPRMPDLAERILRFSLKPGMWKNTDAEGYPANEHGVSDGHFTCHTHYLIYLLDYAIATHNDWLKQFVREAYDYQRAGGVSRLGWYWPGAQEGDFTVFQIALGVRMSDAGQGDYWDDVDALVRNRLVEQQYVDLPTMRQIAGLKPNDTSRDAMLQKYQGGFTVSWPTSIDKFMYGSNIASGTFGLYHAWHGITRFDKATRVATVNLFLNRTSTWMNVASWLPYQGKVELTNKQAAGVDVRIPGWVDIKEVKCFKNNALFHPARHNHRLFIANLAPGDVIRLEFPQPVSTDHYYLPTFGHNYAITWRGSTVVDIQPHDGAFPGYPPQWPILQRDHMKTATTVDRARVKRFVAENVLPLF